MEIMVFQSYNEKICDVEFQIMINSRATNKFLFELLRVTSLGLKSCWPESVWV